MSNELGTLDVKIRIDKSAFDAGLKGINQQMSLLDSQFRANAAGIKGFTSSIQGLAAKKDLLNGKITLQVAKLKELEVQLEKAKKKFGENSAQVNKAQMDYNNAVGALKRFQSQLSSVSAELSRQQSAWTKLGTGLSTLSASMSRIGTGMVNVGKSLTAYVTLPLAAVGAAGIKAGMDFEQGMQNIKALGGSTGEEMKKLKELALDMGRKTTFGATQAAQGIEELAKAGLTTEQILSGGLKGALTLAAAGGIELGEAAELAATALNAFKADNLSVADAANILAGAANASAADIKGLQLGLQMSSAVAAGAGMSFKDTATALAVFAQNGLKSSDAGTSLKTMLMNLNPTTDKQVEAMTALGLVTKEGANQFYNAQGQLKPLADISEILKQKLKGLTDQQRMATLETIFGSDAIRAANILYKEGAVGVNNMKNAMGNTTAEQVAKEKMDTLAGSLQQLKNKWNDLMIELFNGKNGALKDIVAMLSGLIDKFKALDPDMQKNIVNMAAITAVAAPLIIALGAVANGLSAIFSVGGQVAQWLGGFGLASATATTAVEGTAAAVGGGATAAGASGGLAAALAALASPAGIAVAVLGSLAAAGGALYYKLQQEVIPTVDLFGENVSKSTQKALEGYMKLDKDASQSLSNLHANSIVITDQISQGLISKFDVMGNMIAQGLQQDFQSSYAAIENIFKETSTIVDVEERGILENMRSANQEKINELNNLKEKEKAIINQAKNEKRQLYDSERAELGVLQDLMKDKAVRTLTQTELEYKSIMEKMKANTTRLKAEEVANVVKSANDMRDKAISAANAKYDATVRAAIRERDETGSITAEQAERIIRAAQNQKDKAIQEAEGMRNGVLGKLQKMDSETFNEVNATTGKIKTVWESLASWWNNLTFGKKTFEVETRYTISGVQPKDQEGNVIKGLEGVKKKAGNLGADTAKNYLGGFDKGMAIKSPSREMIKRGAYIVQGTAVGIENNIKIVEKASQKIQDAIKGSFDESKNWIDDRKYYNELSLQEEYETWLRIQQKYAEGSEERKKADREVFRVKNELIKDDFNNSKEWIDEKKYYGELSLQEEYEAWRRVQARFLEGTEERATAERELYRVLGELEREGFNNSKNWIDEKKYYGQLTLAEEYAAWKRVHDRYVAGSKERVEAEKEMYRLLKAQSEEYFNTEYDYIDEKRFYGIRDIDQELQILRDLREKNWENPDALKKINRDIFTLEQEKKDYIEKNTKTIEKIKQESNDRLAEIEKEYYDKVDKQNELLNDNINKVNADRDKKIAERRQKLNAEILSVQQEYAKKMSDVNKKLNDDIKAANDEYDRAIKDRENSIYNSFGLFDEAKIQKMSGGLLSKNLRTQLESYKVFQAAVENLRSRGVSNEFVTELKDMGVKSVSQINAINKMSDKELQQYVAMWTEKHQIAKEQSVKELEGMKVQTVEKIKQLKLDANRELSILRDESTQRIRELRINAHTDMEQMRLDALNTVNNMIADADKNLKDYKDVFDKNIADLTKNTTTELEKLAESGKGIGEGLMNKLIEGIKAMEEPLKNKIKSVKEMIDSVATEYGKMFDVGNTQVKGGATLSDNMNTVRTANVTKTGAPNVNVTVQGNVVGQNGIKEFAKTVSSVISSSYGVRVGGAY